jgi:hypothetical protein
MRGNIERVVERQHQEITKENGDVVPYRLLFQGGRRRETRLLDQTAQSSDDLAREEQRIGTGQGHGRVGEDLGRQRAESAEHRPFDETVEHDVEQVAHLANVRPDLRLDRRVHVVLLDRQRDQLVEDHRDFGAFVVVVLLAETRQIGQPFGHVLETEMFQFDGRVSEAFDTFFEKLQRQMCFFERELLRDRLDEDRVVRRDAEAGRLEQLPFDAQIERLRQRAKKIVGGRAQRRVQRAEIEQGDVEQRAGHVFRPNLVVDLDRVGLRQFLDEHKREARARVNGAESASPVDSPIGCECE